VVTICRFVAKYTGMTLRSYDNSTQYNHDLVADLKQYQPEILCLRNAKDAERRQLPEFRGFHMIRDPRDILVSGYFSHLNTHPTKSWKGLEPHREKLKKISKEEGLIAEIEFSENVFRDLDGWDYNQSNVLELKYEEFLVNPYQAMLDAFDFVNLVDWDEPSKAQWLESFLVLYNHKVHNKLPFWPLFPRREQIPHYLLLYKCHETRFSKLTGGRREGEEDTKSHYRKGVAGDWMGHFTPEIEAAFKERFPGLIEKLGYTW